MYEYFLDILWLFKFTVGIYVSNKKIQFWKEEKKKQNSSRQKWRIRLVYAEFYFLNIQKQKKIGKQITGKII